MKEEIIELLSDIRPNVDYSDAKALIDDSVLDSFDVVSLASELRDRYDIEITAEHLVPENFNSVDAICALVQMLQNE